MKNGKLGILLESFVMVIMTTICVCSVVSVCMTVSYFKATLELLSI